ncbi:MAG: hypothetical protein ACR2H0_02925 [Candidatus Limnocylindrales bacterium]
MDEIGRDYVVLGLALGELEKGSVDSYYGPAELREQATARQASADELVTEAAALRVRVNAEGLKEQRRRWLDRQLIALETIARRVAGEEMSYLEEVERCFDAAPEPTPPEAYAKLRRELDDLLPRGGTLHERLEARDAQLTIPGEHVAGVVDWLLGEIGSLCAEFIPGPERESLTVSFVTNEPWAAYNWYDGNLRSRIEVNTDLPTRAHALVGLLTHETFPGHHLEHSWKEQRLFSERGLVEASIQLINTPEAYISEGLAEVGGDLLVSAERWQALLVSIGERAGIAISVADAEREWLVNQALRALRGSSGDAALQLHAGGKSRDEVRRFLVDDALRSPQQAEKTLEFITHPLWRTYVFCYAGGQQLLEEWCAVAGDSTAQRDRFFRLLTEQLTPSGIAEELAAA